MLCQLLCRPNIYIFFEVKRFLKKIKRLNRFGSQSCRLNWWFLVFLAFFLIFSFQREPDMSGYQFMVQLVGPIWFLKPWCQSTSLLKPEEWIKLGKIGKPLFQLGKLGIILLKPFSRVSLLEEKLVSLSNHQHHIE